VVETWVNRTAAHDLDGAMSVLDNNIIVRPDPARQPAYGPVAQCSSYPFTRDNSIVRLDELYVVGGPTDTMVLFKRADNNANAAPPGARGAGFGGFTVQVGVMVRVSNGRILSGWTRRSAGLGTRQLIGGRAHATARRDQRCRCLQKCHQSLG
jgi:hypothetical protein